MYGAFFLSSLGNGMLNFSQRSFRTPSFSFARVLSLTILQILYCSKLIGCFTPNAVITAPFALERFCSSSIARISGSLRVSPRTVCCFTFAAIREKNEATCWAVRNSDTLNSRSPSDPHARRISLATTSASSFMPLSWPMLNLAVRYWRC